MKALKKYFFHGLLFVMPIAITVLICVSLYNWLEEPIGNFAEESLGITVVAAIGLVLIGFLSSNIIVRSLMRFLDSLFKRFPLIKLLYTSIKDLIGAFVGDKKKFDRPVLVTLVPGSDIKAIGFITHDSMAAWGLAENVAVYLPQSYNFAGSLLVVPAEQVTPLDAPSGDVMAFVVSGGVTGEPKNLAQCWNHRRQVESAERAAQDVILPSRIRITREAYRVADSSCVTMTMVWP